MYCDSDNTLVTWSSFGDSYTRLVPDKHPWTLDDDEWLLIEESIIQCPNGGRFKFSGPPRCPFCNGELPQPKSESIYFLVLGDWLNGELQEVFRNES